MERNYCTLEGRVTQRYIDYLEARARGGAGLLYTEATYVDPRGKGRALQMGLHDDDLIPDLARMVRAVHRHACLIGPELNYGGRVVQPWISGLESRAPSAVPYAGAGGHVPRALQREEIELIVERFAAAARRAAEADCDFVGLHGAHGYLISQFLSPWCNKRDDEYGRDLDGRMRFPIEVVRAVRKTVGTSMPILFRISGDEHQDGGLTIHDVCNIAPRLVEAGVDLIDVSAGMYETNSWITQPMEMPQAVLAPLAREVRKCVDIPISVSGRISDPSVAEHVLESGSSDFVTLGRALHADPFFPEKARTRRTAEICACIACNQGCSDMHARGAPIVCLVNSATGREREYTLSSAPLHRKVVVVGGGPAGLEASWILARRGHSVVLFERNEQLGGQMLLSRFVPGREEFAGHVVWLGGEVERAGVRVHASVQADVTRIMAERPDVVIIATGSHIAIPPIPGALESPIVDAYEVLRRPIDGIKRALVIGGGIRGIGVASVLSAKGCKVILVEAEGTLLQDIATRSRPFHLERLKRQNVDLYTRTTVEALTERTATLSNGDNRWDELALNIVVPTGMLVPANALANALYDGFPALEIHAIGDCDRPRTALEAIHDAAALAQRL